MRLLELQINNLDSAFDSRRKRVRVKDDIFRGGFESPESGVFRIPPLLRFILQVLGSELAI